MRWKPKPEAIKIKLLGMCERAGGGYFEKCRNIMLNGVGIDRRDCGRAA